MSDISKNIRRFRKKGNYTQEGLADKLNVTRQTISNWETDKSYPDLDMVIRLARALNTDTNNLLYPPEAGGKKRPYRPVSFKPILIIFVIFSLAMTVGSGLISTLLQPILGGGAAETYIYPIYGGIILLAVLIVTCTCVMIEELRNLDFSKESDEEK